MGDQQPLIPVDLPRDFTLTYSPESRLFEVDDDEASDERRLGEEPRTPRAASIFEAPPDGDSIAAGGAVRPSVHLDETLQYAKRPEGAAGASSDAMPDASRVRAIRDTLGGDPSLFEGTTKGGGGGRREEGGAFTLRRKIGEGGCGEIWEARQGSLGRLVAIKRIRSDLRFGMGPGDTRRKVAARVFEQEAAATALLEHPNIVPIHDLGRDAEGSPLLAMKLVKGRPWDEALKEDFAALSPADLLAKHLPVLESVAQAVAFAHSRGIVHRDLKPAQVMTGEFGEILLMDWGLAVFAGTREQIDELRGSSAEISIAGLDDGGEEPSIPDDLTLATLETASSPAGTPALMAPEQVAADASGIGPWTDVYLLGGTLYFLLTGNFPHAALSTRECMLRAAKGVVAPPEKKAPDRDVPPALSAICMKALAKEPADRHASAREFVADVEDYLTGASRRRESGELASGVKAKLEEGIASYKGYAECVGMLDRARHLWPDNPAAPRLMDRALSGYAETALAGGDLNLALFQAERVEETAAREALLERVAAERAKVAARDRQRRWLGRGVWALIVAIAGISAAFNASLAAKQKKLEESLGEQKRLALGWQERAKELNCFYSVGNLARNAGNMGSVLRQTVDLLPPAWQHVDVACARITFDGEVHQSKNFGESPWRQASAIIVDWEPRGVVEVFYKAQRPEEWEGPFFREERNLIDGVARLLAETATRLEGAAERERLARDLERRADEMELMAKARAALLHAGDPRSGLVDLADLAATATQYPAIARARLILDGETLLGSRGDWPEGPWTLSVEILADGKPRGELQVAYAREVPSVEGGYFTSQEKRLAKLLADLIGEEIARREGKR